MLLNAKISLCVFLLLYTYSERIQEKCLSLKREYGEFRVVLGTQNPLRIHGKNLRVHREDAKRHKTVYIVGNNNTNFNFLDSFYLHYVGWMNPKHNFF
jgi:hypothetical protein